MTRVTSQIEIGASAQRVWEVLTDFDSYADWNPFITAISARTWLRTELRLKTRLRSRREVRSRAHLLTLEPGRRLSWRGYRVMPGLLDREHAVEIEPLPAGRAHVEHSLLVSGLLAPVLARRTAPIGNGLDQMNEALRRRAEAAPG